MHYRYFGHDYRKLDNEDYQDLRTLQAERAIYSEQWIDELDDFRFVRIRFTEEEAKEYARRYWAFDVYLRSSRTKPAAKIRNIPADIAADADSYPGPQCCAAAFLGKHLEALVCGWIPERREILEEHGKQLVLSTIRRAVDALAPAIRTFHQRESGLKPWLIKREDDVRDLLYVMLRASVPDLRVEEAIPSKAGRHKFVDLCSPLSTTLIEVKWIGRKGRWRRIVDEISVDIQAYARHPACKTLVFLILDAAKDIRDPALLETELSGRQQIDGKHINVVVYVREP